MGISFILNATKYNLFNLYHSPPSSDAEFLEFFEKFLSEKVKRDGIFIIMEDFNLDASKNSFYATKLQKIIHNHGLYQQIRAFTRVIKASASILDLMITNCKTIQHEVLPTPKIADHHLILASLEDKV